MTNPNSTHGVPPSDAPEPLSEFQEGQWWVTELDAMVADGTAEQKRAVAVVHHMLRSARAYGVGEVPRG